MSLTANGVSLYYAATKDPALAEIAEDIRTTNLPIGPVGKSVELHQTTSISIFNHTQVPAGGDGLPASSCTTPARMNAWIEGASAYCCGARKDFANNPVWTSNPIHAPYAKASSTLRPNGYAGPLGYASAGVMADYVLVDMFAAGGHRPGLDRRRHRQRGEAAPTATTR